MNEEEKEFKKEEAETDRMAQQIYIWFRHENVDLIRAVKVIQKVTKMLQKVADELIKKRNEERGIKQDD